MKTPATGLLLLASVFCFLMISLTSCTKSMEYRYTGYVVGKGIDCGETYLIRVDQKLYSVYETVNYTYYADQLPDAYKKQGLVIHFNCRRPASSESYPCTALGYAYTHIVITDVE